MESITNWNELRDKAHKNAVAHGFWENNPSPEHFLCLVVSELMEAVDAYQNQRLAAIPRDRRNTSFDPCVFHPENVYYREKFELVIKDTLEDELADAVIRILSMAGGYNIDLDNVSVSLSPLFIPSDMSFTEVIFEIVKVLCSTNYRTDFILNYCLRAICKVAEHRNIDIAWYIEHKMNYNEGREYKHGKSY